MHCNLRNCTDERLFFVSSNSSIVILIQLKGNDEKIDQKHLVISSPEVQGFKGHFQNNDFFHLIKHLPM